MKLNFLEMMVKMAAGLWESTRPLIFLSILSTVTILPTHLDAKQSLNAGDIFYVDSGNALEGGGLFKLDAITGERSLVSKGGLMVMPFGVAFDSRSGNLFISDSGRLLKVEPESGEQTLVLNNNSGSTGSPCGMDFNAQGDLLVANTVAVLKMNLRQQEAPAVISTGQSLICPIGVGAGKNDDLFVVDPAAAAVIRVDLRTGAQNVLSRGGLLIQPQAITVSGQDIYVTGVATADGNFGIGRVVRINAVTGAQSIVAEGGFLVGPVGISISPAGELVVADPYTINEHSVDLFDGGIVVIDPESGSQRLLARGEAGFVNPRGLTVVPKNVSR